MKVKDLVKGKTYRVFDYKSFSVCLNCFDDDCSVPAAYLGRFNGKYWFERLDTLDYDNY